MPLAHVRSPEYLAEKGDASLLRFAWDSSHASDRSRDRAIIRGATNDEMWLPVGYQFKVRTGPFVSARDRGKTSAPLEHP